MTSFPRNQTKPSFDCLFPLLGNEACELRVVGEELAEGFGDFPDGSVHAAVDVGDIALAVCGGVQEFVEKGLGEIVGRVWNFEVDTVDLAIGIALNFHLVHEHGGATRGYGPSLVAETKGTREGLSTESGAEQQDEDRWFHGSITTAPSRVGWW